MDEYGNWSPIPGYYGVSVGNYYMLSLTATEVTYGYISTNLYIDGQGTTGGSFFLPEGWHNIAADYVGSYENGNAYFIGFDVNGQWYTDNPLDIYLNQPTNAIAYYSP